MELAQLAVQAQQVQPSFTPLAAGLAIGLGAIGRNPEATGTLFLPLIIGLAFAEAIAIYALIIAFLLFGRA